MRKVDHHRQPEHGLQIEETLAAGDVEGAIHLARYWWAWTVAKRLRSPRIWDLGCGCGYGSRILVEQTGATVIGVDCEARALRAARGDYGGTSGLMFVNLFLARPWNLPELAVAPDLVVMFELLSQCQHREWILEELVRCAGPGTIVLISESFAGRAKPDPDPRDAYFGYTRELLERFLSRYFAVLCFGQDGGAPFEFLAEATRTIAAKAAPNAPPLGLAENLIYCAQPKG